MTTDAGERLPDIENGVAWTSTLKPSHRRSSHRPKHRSKPAEPTTPTSPAAGTSGSPSPRCGGQRRSEGGSLSRWRPHRASALPQRRCTGTRAPVRPQRGSRRTTNAQECECFPAGSIPGCRLLPRAATDSGRSPCTGRGPLVADWAGPIDCHLDPEAGSCFCRRQDVWAR